MATAKMVTWAEKAVGRVAGALAENNMIIPVRDLGDMMSSRNHLLILIVIMAICTYCLLFGDAGKTLDKELCKKINITRSAWIAEEIAAGALPPDYPRTLPCMESYQTIVPTSDPILTPEQKRAELKAAAARIRQREAEAEAYRIADEEQELETMEKL